MWRLDEESGKRDGAPIKVGKDPADIAIGRGSVWTANYDSGDLTRIKPSK